MKIARLFQYQSSFMKNLIFLHILITVFCSCEQKQAVSSTQNRNSMMTQRDTLIGIKGCDKAQFEETQTGNAFIYPQIKVTTIPSEDGIGDEIYVISPNQKDTFWIENIEAYHFMGIKNDLLFIDNGTGPNGRAVLIYDLKTRKLIHEARYEGDLSIAGGKMTYKTPIDTRNIRLMASVCPDREKWEKQGLNAGYAEFMAFDLKTREAEQTGEYTCYVIQ
jgi:hypothetical protein